MITTASKKSLSIGFGPKHYQEFFDTLQAYDDYIRDYFFAIHYGVGGLPYEHDEIACLRKLEQYNYPANLLFNQIHDIQQICDSMRVAKDVVNLRAVTVLDPSITDVLKRFMPGLEVHLSVRFWDWGRFNKPIARLAEVRDMGIDVINVSGKCQYNDFEFINRIHELGMKTKYITDEDCVIGADLNYSNFPGYGDYMCRPNPFCTRSCSSGCFAVQKEYPWMELASNNIYKESLHYYPPIDILKISGRPRDMQYVNYHIDYWTNEYPTGLITTHTHTFDVSGKYDVFLDYVEYKSTKCRGNCIKCQKCKQFYDEFTS